MPKILRVYTDGACSQAAASSGPGGWGVYIDYGNETSREEKTILGAAEKETTNNRMELTAFLNGMLKGAEISKQLGITNFYIYTDSAYIHNCFQQKWYLNWEKNGWKNAKRQPVANQELWQGILKVWRELGKLGYFVNMVKVKAHTKPGSKEYHKGNDIADSIAVQYREEAKKL